MCKCYFTKNPNQIFFLGGGGEVRREKGGAE